MELSAVRNLEVKARARAGLDILRERLYSLRAVHHWTRQQTDVFYHTPRGRLKLRREDEGGQLRRAQLIPYLRPDDDGVRESRFAVLEVAAPGALDEVLAVMLGRRLTVKKTRELWLLHNGTVRVHLDHVTGLGEFCEIEAIVETTTGVGDLRYSSQAFAALQAQRTVELLQVLGITPDDHVTVAYADLLDRAAP